MVCFCVFFRFCRLFFGKLPKGYDDTLDFFHFVVVFLFFFYFLSFNLFLFTVFPLLVFVFVVFFLVLQHTEYNKMRSHATDTRVVIYTST